MWGYNRIAVLKICHKNMEICSRFNKELSATFLVSTLLSVTYFNFQSTNTEDLPQNIYNNTVSLLLLPRDCMKEPVRAALVGTLLLLLSP
jgi:hypothetical protein